MKAVAPLYVLACVGYVAGCCYALNATERAQIADDQSKIDRCQAVGVACKAADAGDCFRRYDACMHDAGLR